MALAPQSTGATINITENDGWVWFNGNYYISSSFSDQDGGTFAGFYVDAIHGLGTFRINGAEVEAGRFITAADINQYGMYWYNGDSSKNQNRENAVTPKLDIRVVDSQGDIAEETASILIDLRPVNDAPTAADAVIEIEEDAPYTLNVADFGFADVDGDALSAVIIEQLPSAGTLMLDGVAIMANQSVSVADIASGKLIWYPPENGNGASLTSFLFKVVDDASGSESNGWRPGTLQSLSSYTLTFDVTAVNDAPVVGSSIAARTAFEDDVFDFTFAADTFTDVDAGDTLTYSAELADGSALPDWLSFDGATRTFSGTPGQDDVGDLVVKVTATDGDGEAVSTTFDLTVENVNDAPVLAVKTAATREDSRVSIDVLSDAFDEDGDTLTVTGAVVVSGFGSVSIGEDGALVYDPTTADQDLAAGQSRKVVIRYTVEDGNGGETTADVTVTVAGVGSGVFKGATSRDVLKGSVHGDTLHGYGGNDVLDGGRGADRMYGGTGHDTYIVDNRADRAIELKGQGIDLVKASVSFALGSHVENLTLTGGGNLNGTGNGLANTMTGNNGANVLKGMGGNDVLKGLGGKDRLEGGSGADKLHGGGGADQFVFLSHTDSTVGAGGRDTILDFSRAQRDKINLAAIDADAKAKGNQKFEFIGTDKFHKDAGELRFQKQGGDTLLLADRNGDGKADFSILVDGHIAFKAGDFLL